jgi:hypothetical protein
MNALAAPVAHKLQKLLPLLASDKGGEVLGTVNAIRRTLGAHGLDLHDLAKAIAAAAEPPPQHERASSCDVVPLWENMLPGQRQILLERLLAWGGLSDFEAAFCVQMRQHAGKYTRPPSPKQVVVLNQIILKGWREGICACLRRPSFLGSGRFNRTTQFPAPHSS